jgi:hypothetical protein
LVNAYVVLKLQRAAGKPEIEDSTITPATMRWLLSFLLLGLAAVAQAVSSSGSKLLVVLEELADKTKYSKYLGDLESKDNSIIPSSLKSNVY